MGMTSAYRDAIARAGADVISHIGLIDEDGRELSGGSPAYSRQPVQWTIPSDGNIQIAEDLIFNVPPGLTVAGWRGYSALTGGTLFGGSDLLPETFAGQGEYRLLADATGIIHATI